MQTRLSHSLCLQPMTSAPTHRQLIQKLLLVTLQEQNCQTPLQHLQLLIAALRHESVAVRHVGLGEVCSFLLKYKTFMGDAMSGLLSCSGPAAPPGVNLSW